jgi:uncharacterized protein
MEHDEIDDGVHLLWVGILLEGSLVGVALILSWFGLFDHLQPLHELNAAKLWQGLVWGVMATIPMLLLPVAIHFFPTRLLQPIRDFCQTRLQPIFRDSSWLELAILSLLAGLGEELLFRWCLQGGITSLLAERSGIIAAATVGLIVASILFGLCHWVTTSYGLIALFIGAYLGLAMIWTDNFLVPAVAHALYDFIALIYIVRMEPRGISYN